MANPALEPDRRFESIAISFPDRRAETRRRFRRFLLSLPVSCRDHARLFESYSLDIGLGGMSMLAMQPKPLGGELILQFSFSPDLYVEFHSEVVHASDQNDPGRQATVGLQFIRGTDTERKALASYLAGVANMAIPPQPTWSPTLNWHRSEFLCEHMVQATGTGRTGQADAAPMEWERQIKDEFVRAVIPDVWHARGLQLVTVEATIHHAVGATAEAALLLRLKITSIKRSTINVRFDYLSPATRRIVAQGQQIFAFSNTNGRLIPVPAEFLTYYRQRFV
ncbi:MAG TPA: PilZ domain-containing protein [Nitrospiria bacterium]|nr:PilZ domain-containing protein [Nitrospiria bacterium]